MSQDEEALQQRRASDGTGVATILGALPEWARPMAALGMLFGAPTMIAMFLLYFVTQQVTADLADRGREHVTIAASMQNLTDLLVAHQSFDAQESKERTKLLRAICIRVSTTDAQRIECQLN